MIFLSTILKGVWIIKPEKIGDERGFFARSFCRNEFKRLGLNTRIAQCNISFNKKKGTLRGMHYQAPMAEDKLVRCTKGAVYDVVADIRRDSPTFCRWISAELNGNEHQMVYIPKGFAHGFQTLKDNSEVFYQMSEFFEPGASRGIRWDDPALGIKWPIGTPILSERDRSYEDLIS